jgi:NADPH-dependent 2,4-dienoyl-CoA reductase/sulfur reductase-like enzyme
MALDIGIISRSNNADPLERNLVVSLEYVEFSYLLDKFEHFENITSVRISDCEDARIQGGQLDLLHGLKKIAWLKQENDLLKKWQRFLAQQHQNDLSS